ncbi:hypothetical protein CB0940_00544 [Cercospora beticola]|uniref:Uncharacterized protein n=1 Tax=Cercospora beticola TaxID=122368 RepID=A0A2G5I7X7_CERBT|nr:hypothetical protein CB0940_00544 [Cercospora beticola]PIB00879.1 hypothetical protein CB0940_00544 [Cercospora beticola]WPA95963.1 hypothetical protein RHO25_000568 [Cercospora beticola]CAK1355767.1 unnamed protein product [Cercospora beticola]
MSSANGLAQHVPAGGNTVPRRPTTGGKRLPGRATTGGKRLPGQSSTGDKGLPEHASSHEENFPKHLSTSGKKLPGRGSYRSIGGKRLPEHVETGGSGLPPPLPETGLEVDNDDGAVIQREVGEDDGNAMVDGELDDEGDAVVEDGNNDEDASPASEVDNDTTSPLRNTTRDTETPGNRPSSSEEVALTLPKATETTRTKRKKHRPMDKTEQEEQMKRLQAQLDLFPQPDKKEDSVVAAAINPNQTTSPAIPSSPNSAQEIAKPGSKRPGKKRKSTSLTQTAQVESPQAGKNSKPTRAKKQKASETDEAMERVYEKLSPEAKVVMSTLRDLGSRFETSLDAVATNAGAVLSASGLGGNAAVAADVAGLVGAWKESHREHLGGVVSLLERYGVLAMGAVEVPNGDNGGNVSGGREEDTGGAGGLFDGVEIGEDGEARISAA